VVSLRRQQPIPALRLKAAVAPAAVAVAPAAAAVAPAAAAVAPAAAAVLVFAAQEAWAGAGRRPAPLLAPEHREAEGPAS